jgi:hypothetical protein
MTAMKLGAAAALRLGATLGMTTASLAQPYYGAPYSYGYYNYAPGYAPYNYGYYGYGASDCNRGGAGPRVGCGSGPGIGSQR